jgi:transposase-like protein
MAIKKELIQELLKDYKSPEDILGENGLLKQLTKSILESALESEMTQHLGYEKNDRSVIKAGNSRNGKSDKVLKTDQGNLPIEVPRDRNSDFEPQIIQKRQTRFDGFDDKIISMYARGMTTRDIAAHLKEIYQVEVSADFISKVTDSVIEKVKEWQNRPLDKIYPIVYLDCLVVKVRDEGRIVNKSVFIAIGINMDGLKDILGLWIEKNEGAKFWLSVITELKNRGIEDIYIACVDGLKGFPEAINSVFPKTEIQLCIVHMVRNSLKYVSYKVRKELAKDLKMIYQSVNAEMAEKNLNDFAQKWDNKYPMISKSWKSNWDKVIPFLGFPDDIRRVIYTTNAIESLNMTLRKVIKNRASFPTDEAVFKLLYLSLQRISKKWTMPIKEWGCALNQFAILYKERVPE